MKHIALFAALALAACQTGAPVNILPIPVTIADRTVADEQVASGLELGYKAFRVALELGVDTGAIKGARATLAASADQRAYTALLAARAAYRTANAPSYIAAAREANAAIASGIAAVKGAK